MNNTSNKNEIDFLKQYEAKGFTHSFRVAAGKLIDNTTKKSFTSNEIYILADHRFEGMSNPDDMSILYVIKTADGSKGTFLAPYGATADNESAMFFKEIPKENISNEENISMNG